MQTTPVVTPRMWARAALPFLAAMAALVLAFALPAPFGLVSGLVLECVACVAAGGDDGADVQSPRPDHRGR